MIGRAAQGNPWIFSEILYQKKRPSGQEILDTIIRHGKLQLEYKGEYIGIREMRKHVSWYTTGLPNSAKLRQHINEMETFEQLNEALRLIFLES